MNDVLIICQDYQQQRQIKEVLLKLKVTNVMYASSIEIAKKKMLEKYFELIIIDTTLSSAIYLDFAKNITKTSNSQVLVLLKVEFYDNLSFELEQMGIYTLAKPYTKITLFNVLKMCSIAIKNINKIQNEVTKLQKQITSIRLVNQAKLILIQKFKISEDEAHHFIEKKAMDYQTTKVIIARKIINKYS